jgi:pfkB family carbohydrate kinase
MVRPIPLARAFPQRKKRLCLYAVEDVARPGQTISSTKFERCPCGKGANQAVAIARAGGAVSFVGAVGEDGGWVVRDLERCGVSTANVSVVQVCPSVHEPNPPGALTGVHCRRRSLAALSFNLHRMVKIASVRLCPPVPI